MNSGRKSSLGRNQKPKPQIPVLVKRNNVTIVPTVVANHDMVVPSNDRPTSTASNTSVKVKPHFMKAVLPSISGNLSNMKLQQQNQNPLENIRIQNLRDFDQQMDDFMNLTISSPFYQAIETFFNQYFRGTTCLWDDINSLQTMYSMSLKKTCKRDRGIPGATFVGRQTIKVDRAGSHPAYDSAIDGALGSEENSLISFPIWSYRNSIIGIVEVSRPQEPFTEVEEAFVMHFTQKIKLLSKWILQPQVNDQPIFDIIQLLSLEQFAAVFKSKITQLFNCRVCEVWSYRKDTQEITMMSDSLVHMQPPKGGIVADSLLNHKVINCQLNKLHSCYNMEFDFKNDEAVLVVPVIQSQVNYDYAVCIRGPKANSIFTRYDEDLLKKIAPYIALAFSNSTLHSEFFNDFQNSKFEQDGLAALLEVAEVLSSQLDIDKLTETIMEKGRTLTNADRCSLFLINETGERLITSFQHGLDTAIDLPIRRGAVGLAVKEQKVVNIADAYQDPNFDRSTDIESGYHTNTLLCVPIFNQKGEVIGVTEMVNKLDGKPFSEWDAKVIQIFNVFCGISIQNAKLYKESVDMETQLQSFFDVSVAVSKSEDMKEVLQQIIARSRDAAEAERASIFLFDPANDCLKVFLADGTNVPETLPMNTGIAAQCVKLRRAIVANDVYHDPRFNRSVDTASGFKTNNLVVVPLLTPGGDILGVVEMCNKKDGDFDDHDAKLVQSFASFVEMTLEKFELKNIASLGETEIEMLKWIGESERESCTEIPLRLRLKEEQIQNLRQLNFMALDWEPMDRIKSIIYQFYSFGIPQEFRISNQMLFRFIWEVMRTYHSTPYHNWIHAVDVVQYVSYEMRLGELENIFTKFEIFAMLVAAVCHDAGHSGFNNIYNVKAETPLGILFKEQSVMETYHCTVAISILTRKECNLFHSITEEAQKQMWTLIIKLILATDMAFHFKMVKAATEFMDAGPFNPNDPEQRLIAFQLVLKTADISNVSRPFKVADKWCDVLCEEFFRQGDKEKAQAFGLTSPLNDRDNPDKPKSQIGFYNFVCIPLYSVISRIFPKFEVNLNSVKSNLEVWKSLSQPQQQAQQQPAKK
ncbi:3'5'-cyclic nucleotide phosphodiesterase family protein [Trichomonas vaginalis G3]|uniref:3'5'-cyclic nucleotide phosphodiesterase family protein n=1 Tax=Trichomonas vaginalis (strain ATCC PRA-98 / G3) TaxID=412133 RepID=A2FBN7_TRIV3|nr:cyclic nucleotide phosphodiesterase family [Trichomonas vaginalis G3]EAX97674.1 3'5'-cyclic nucleotide phosphodiesterase family protein [Trichomonas vaginalis G3]KAI5486329.1 cyclic nucleotide phosphodiesterase family [Trichomonas vaginalis G3]|eukprot:XP_001310604.1 3'5'-cyclic nucleotide phosphodiesterase family protein [Trichomonas vaginalis G3]